MIEPENVPPRTTWRVLGLALVPALVPVLVFSKGLVGRVVIAPGDALIYYLPVHILTARAWSDFTIPGWNPYAFSGSPLLASNQPGAFYPPNLLFIVLPAFVANNVLVVLNVAIAGAGAYMLSRKLSGDDLAAIVAGVAFVSCGFMYAHIPHQSIEASVAWIPWAIYGYLRLRERRSGGRFFFAGGVLAMSLLAGASQFFFLAILGLTIYALVLLVLEQTGGPRRVAIGVAILGGIGVIEIFVPRSSRADAAFLVIDAVVILVWLVHLALRALRTHGPRDAKTLRTWSSLAGMILLALALGAIQLLPIASILGQTIRAKLTFGTATTFSLPPSHLPLLLFPYLFGNQFPFAPFDTPYRGAWNLTELTAYPGLACLVFAAAGLPSALRNPKIAALGVVALVFVGVALGASTGIGEIVWLTPVYGQVRSWARYLVILDLVIALLAAHGVATLRRTSGRERASALRRTWIAFALLIMAGVVLPLIPRVAHYRAPANAAILSVAVPLVAALSAVLVCRLFRNRPWLAVGVCCLLVAVDGLASFGASFEWRTSPSTAEARKAYSQDTPTPWGVPPSDGGGIVRFFYDGLAYGPGTPYLPQLTDVKGLRSLNGYDPLAPATYINAVGKMDGSGIVNQPGQALEHPSDLLDILRVTLILIPPAEVPSSVSPTMTRLPRADGLARFVYRPRVRDAFLVGAVKQEPNSAALDRLSRSRSFPLDKAALVDTPCPSCQGLASPGNAGEVMSEHWRDNDITMKVDASRQALLVVSQSWFPGWSATVDGKTAAVVRTDGLVMGVVIPPGAHDVSLAYRPPGLSLGAAATAGVLAAFGIGGLVSWTRRRRRSTASAP